MSSTSTKKKLATFGIAALCFGYFASYVPYSMMTKMITKGLFSGMGGTGFSGFEIQPAAVTGNLIVMFLFLTLSGWWKHATHSKIFGISFPRPQWYTFISGICTAGIIITTTLAYTFSGISIVFAMLLMRGGVLVLGPVIDTIARRRKRKIYWPSWVAAGLSFGALLVAFAGKAGTNMTTIAIIDISLYLGCYFFRLFFMSNRAKSENLEERKGYVAEEQLVANPLLFIALLVVGLIGSGMGPETIPGKIWSGFTTFPFSGYFFYAFFIGIFSYGTGIFGSLILLDKRENTFTIPANRCSSIVAGVIATYLLAIFFDQRYPSTYQMIGVVLILSAIIFLSYRSIVEKKALKAGTPAKKKSVQSNSNLEPATDTE